MYPLRRPFLLLTGRCLVSWLVPMCLGLAGCSRTQPPWPTPEANARVERHLLPCRFHVETGDTGLLVRFHSADEFARRRRGNWIYTWSVIRFEVLRVERGAWPAPGLSFILCEAAPTPESGIMLMARPQLYRPGAVFRYGIDTTTRPPTVVCEDSFSALPQDGAAQSRPAM